jgi:endonuclease/exonuclease/phosphatase family metal-dependent hydrolase
MIRPFVLVFLMSLVGLSLGIDVRPPSTIAIGTFNVRYANESDGENAWKHRQPMVLEMLKDGDFWGLQEALPEQVAAITAALPEYGVVVRSREQDPKQGEACPILFRKARWTLDESEQGTYWLSETPDVAGSKSWDSSLPRIATFARFTETSGKRSIYVVNAHFDHRGERARLESAKLIARRTAARKHADPVVVLGDFNTGPTTEPIRFMLDNAVLGVADAWRVANSEAKERGTFNGWAETCGSERIDFILAARAFQVESCTIDDRKPNGRWPSDHAPVRAVIRWGDESDSIR